MKKIQNLTFLCLFGMFILVAFTVLYLTQKRKSVEYMTFSFKNPFKNPFKKSGSAPKSVAPSSPAVSPKSGAASAVSPKSGAASAVSPKSVAPPPRSRANSAPVLSSSTSSTAIPISKPRSKSISFIKQEPNVESLSVKSSPALDSVYKDFSSLPDKKKNEIYRVLNFQIGVVDEVDIAKLNKFTTSSKEKQQIRSAIKRLSNEPIIDVIRPANLSKKNEAKYMLKQANVIAERDLRNFIKKLGDVEVNPKFLIDKDALPYIPKKGEGLRFDKKYLDILNEKTLKILDNDIQRKKYLPTRKKF